MFGVGGAEWLIIIGAIVLLFVPGAAVFGLGYLVGRKTAAPTAPTAVPGSAPPAAPASPSAQAAEAASPEPAAATPPVSAGPEGPVGDD